MEKTGERKKGKEAVGGGGHGGGIYTILMHIFCFRKSEVHVCSPWKWSYYLVQVCVRAFVHLCLRVFAREGGKRVR